MAQNQELALANFKTIKGLLEKRKSEISAALPKHVNADSMLRVVLTTIRTNPKLLECEPQSFLTAVLISSQFGLLPDGITGQSYIIPFKNNRKGGIIEAQLQLGYKGELELARRSDQIARVEAQVVYEKDDFDYCYGLSPVLRFKPSTEADRGKKLYIYALVTLKDGSPYFEVWTVAMVESHRRKHSKIPDGPAWTHSWDKMAKKTLLKQVLDYCPVSVEYQKASHLDDLAESGQPQNLDIELSPDDFTIVDDEDPQPPKGKLDQIVDEHRQAQPRETDSQSPAPEPAKTESACTDENYSSLVAMLDHAKESGVKDAKIKTIVATYTGPNRKKEELKDNEVLALIKSLADAIEKAK